MTKNTLSGRMYKWMRLNQITVAESVKSLSGVQLFVISWTVACQAPLSMGFSRKEH